MLTRREALLGTVAGAATAAILTVTPAGAQPQPADVSKLPRERVTLVAPPFVHAHEQVATSGPKIVEFVLTVKEQPMVIDDEGTTLQAMTYDGSIPAPMMVVHEGDYVELTLVNPETNEMPHNIDLHAATGALGGAALTEVNPGEQATLRFRAAR
ncbi:MAG TPA: multicopper oxidase domain-containing protein, partial [Sphingomicrobium sp.]|nr:multicopper oxidase domain-containing protein [Sphingomicrobium sp.]